MALEGYNVLITVGSSATPTDEVTDINNFSLGDGRNMLDVTAFENNAGARKRLAGLKDPSLTLSGFFNTDAEQALLRSSHSSGATVYVRIAYAGAGSPYHECAYLVESVDVSGGVDGTADVSYSLVCNGAPTVG